MMNKIQNKKKILKNVDSVCKNNKTIQKSKMKKTAKPVLQIQDQTATQNLKFNTSEMKIGKQNYSSMDNSPKKQLHFKEKIFFSKSLQKLEGVSKSDNLADRPRKKRRICTDEAMKDVVGNQTFYNIDNVPNLFTKQKKLKQVPNNVTLNQTLFNKKPEKHSSGDTFVKNVDLLSADFTRIVPEKSTLKLKDFHSSKKQQPFKGNIKNSAMKYVGNNKKIENHFKPTGRYFSQNYEKNCKTDILEKSADPITADFIRIVPEKSSIDLKNSHSSKNKQSFKGNLKKNAMKYTGNKAESFKNHFRPAGQDFSQKSKVQYPQNRKVYNPKILQGPNAEDERCQRTLFVGNLPLSVNQRALKKIFTPVGDVESARIRLVVPTKLTIPKKVAAMTQNYHETVKSLKGFVVFKTIEDAKKGLKLNGCLVEDRHMRVDFAGNADKCDDRKSVFVGNLPFDVDDESLWRGFSECGDVEGVRIVRDRQTGAGKGFGFVLFKYRQSVEEALAMDGKIIEGRNIRVKAVFQDKKRQQAQANSQEPKKKWHLKLWALKQKNSLKSPYCGKSTKKIMKKKKRELEKKKIAAILTR